MNRGPQAKVRHGVETAEPHEQWVGLAHVLAKGLPGYPPPSPDSRWEAQRFERHRAVSLRRWTAVRRSHAHQTLRMGEL